MDQRVFKKISGLFALLITVGMLVFCVFSIVLLAESGAHGVPFDQVVHTMDAQAFSHEEDVFMSAVAKMVRSFTDLIPVLVFVVFAFRYILELCPNFAFVHYVRQKFYDIAHRVQKIANDWLSLFELSPTFI